MNKALVVTESAYFKFGEIVEGKELAEKGLQVNEHIIAEGNYILLEKLSSQDEDQVRNIVRDLLKRFLWRMYTRSAFLVKESDSSAPNLEAEIFASYLRDVVDYLKEWQQFKKIAQVETRNTLERQCVVDNYNSEISAKDCATAIVRTNFSKIK